MTISSELTFKRVIRIGETARISIEPASFLDLRNPLPYPNKDVNGKPAAAQRNFVMDVHSRRGALIRTVAGKAQPSETASRYVFEVPITPTLDAIGLNIVSFRYVSASGHSVALAGYDSSFGELIEDSALLNYTVSTQLLIADIREQPETNTFAYGQTVVYRFRVKDALSGHYISQGETEQSNIYLSLKHADEARGRPFVSANEPATEITNADGTKVRMLFVS